MSWVDALDLFSGALESLSTVYKPTPTLLPPEAYSGCTIPNLKSGSPRTVQLISSATDAAWHGQQDDSSSIGGPSL